MGFFDFFKKNKVKEELEEEVIFENLDSFIDKRKQKIIKQQESPLSETKEYIFKLIQELEEKIETLRNIDLIEKKEPEKVKLIVRQNLNNFIRYLDNLISSLKELNNHSPSLKDLINKINLIFSYFEKKSLTSFQKSTFIIGKELGDIRDSISDFFKHFKGILEKNKSLIEKSNILHSVEEKLKEFYNIEKRKKENLEKIREHLKKIKSLEEEIEVIKQKIRKTKQTLEYLEQVKKRQKFEKNKTQLIIEVQKLKELINFKTLAAIYHSNKKYMNLLKEYKDNFKQTFEKYPKDDFLELVNIKGINQEAVKNKIKDIEEIEESIKNTSIQKNEVQDLEHEINNTKSKIEDIKHEKFKYEKLNLKINQNLEEIKQEIKKELEIIKVKV